MRARAALVLALAAAGCGDPLVGGDYRPPYGTLAWTLSATGPVPPRPTLTLLWQSDVTTLPRNYATQPIAVQPQLVGGTLAVTELPQEAIDSLPPALYTVGLDPAMRWAAATLVLFSDGNGNGALDIVAGDPASSPDLVIDAASGVAILYLVAGKPAPAAFAGIFPTGPGFSLARESTPVDPQPGDCGAFDDTGHLTRLCEATQPTGTPLPSTAPIPLQLPSAMTQPELQRWACASFRGPLEYADWTFAAPGDVCQDPSCKFCYGYACPLDLPPAGVNPTCSSDGTSYVYKTCVDDPSLCGTRVCHYGHGERRASDPIPAGWPCP
jgi:hypothetical protein